MELTDVIIESERLIQRPIKEEDASEIFKYFTDEVTKYMYPKKPEKIEETLSFIKQAIEGMRANTNLQLVILKKETGEFIGCAGLHKIGQDDPELGVWTKKEAHGNGYGLEAMTAIINWAKQNLEYKYLKYPVDKRNFASRRIPEINGGIIKKEQKIMNLSNFELDEVEYWIYK